MKKVILFLMSFIFLSFLLFSDVITINNESGEVTFVRLYLSNNNTIIDRYIPEINKLIELYNNDSNKGYFLIEAYTGGVGSEDFQKKDADLRSNVVKKFLIDNYEIPEEKIKIEYKGNTNPILKMKTDEAKVVNRRIELSYKKGE